MDVFKKFCPNVAVASSNAANTFESWAGLPLTSALSGMSYLMKRNSMYCVSATRMHRQQAQLHQVNTMSRAAGTPDGYFLASEYLFNAFALFLA